MRKLVFLLTVLVFFCSVAGLLPAQERGSVRGIVKDQDGNTVVGAKVTIAGAFMPQKKEFITGRDGSFVFLSIPTGKYTVLVTHPEMMDFTAEVVVALDKQTFVNVEMFGVGRAVEEVTVMAVAPIIDLKSTEISANWNKDLIERLPLGRSYASLFQLAPGVADNRDFAPNAGGNKQDNVYLYDGSNITNPFFGFLGANFSELDIQEVQIKRGAISAEFGRAAGMVTNAITRSGSNRITGTFRLVAEPAVFTSKFRDPGIVTKYNQYTTSVGVGGPVIKDKLFWYLSANAPYALTTGRINNLGPVPDAKTTSKEFFVKITANPHRAHLFSISLRNNEYTNHNAGVGVNDHPSVAVDGNGSDWILYGSWVWTISQSTLLEVKYDHVKENYKSVPITKLGYRPTFDPNNLPAMGYFRTAPGYIVGGATASGQFVGGASEFNTQNFFRDEIKAVLSHYLDLPWSSHLIKAGFAFDDGGEWLERLANGWGSIIVTTYLGQPAFRCRNYTKQAPQDSRGRTWSIFVQDNVTIAERLTLTLGVLLNQDEFSTKTAGERNTFLKFKFNKEIQPRLGFTFTISPKVSDKLYANWGRYNNMDNRSIARAAAPLRIYRHDTFFSRPEGIMLADTPQAAETGKIILTDQIKPTYTDEFVAGYSRPFPGNWSVEIWGQYRTMKNIIEDFPTRNRETTPSMYVYGNLNGQMLSYGGNPEFQVGRARRVYKAVNFELKKQYSDHWSLNFMYTWSRLEGNWDLDYAPGSALFYASSYLEDGPGLYVSDPNRDGIMIGDRTHVMKIFGTWDFYKNFTLGWFGRLQSGRPWEARALDYFGNYYRYLEKAGANRLENWFNLDLQLSYRIKLSQRLNGTIEARCANVLNLQPILTIDQRADQPSFKSATSYAPPMKFALAFYLNF